LNDFVLDMESPGGFFSLQSIATESIATRSHKDRRGRGARHGTLGWRGCLHLACSLFGSVGNAGKGQVKRRSA
jgi:hypothetical protein